MSKRFSIPAVAAGLVLAAALQAAAQTQLPGEMISNFRDTVTAIGADLVVDTVSTTVSDANSVQARGQEDPSAADDMDFNGIGSIDRAGYFTFKTGRRIKMLAAIPEPSTYALFGLTGVIGFAFRRRLRAMFA